MLTISQFFHEPITKDYSSDFLIEEWELAMRISKQQLIQEMGSSAVSSIVFPKDKVVTNLSQE